MDTVTTSEPQICVESWVKEIISLGTQFDVFRMMRRVTEAYGCRSFIVSELPSRTVLELSGKTIITNWPSELLSLFDQASMLQNSPNLQRMRQSTRPFRYSAVEVARERGDTVAKELFERFGMGEGAFFPAHDPLGNRGAVGFSGEKADFSHQQMMELSYISIHIYQRLAEIRAIDVRPVETLSEREIDCLNWTAAGKTSAEIADILNLSEHTVNHYLNRATKKLNTVNRTQAVAKSLRIGLIK
ncbi:LuxR family transcriptional regulator [Rhizobium sp. FY34]|uniref:LuxR family transcriptional regulator n=1 Tax=Rhizobium sp. FY34 TaxID=2562309 RepID=UPI0010C040B0|nr:LuxR family transcriptional regulator [Rhizobium sp. FY34]